MSQETVAMVDLKSQYKKHEQELKDAIHAVLEEAAFINGPQVKEFETQFAAYCQAKHCVSVGNGTDAVILALQAAGVGLGDEVITTPWTFIATVEAICVLGATPKFVDIDPKTFCIRSEDVEGAITNKTKAILPVHIYGQLANMAPIKAAGKKHQITVIEDSAQAHGAEEETDCDCSHGNVCRAGRCGDMATFSFYPGKNLGAYGDAGAVTTNSQDFATKVNKLKNHGRREKYLHDYIGWNSRLDTIQAAILNVKLKYLDEWTAKRQEKAQKYTDALSQVSNSTGVEIVCPIPTSKRAHVFHLYTIRVPKRDQLAAYLKEKGIACAVHYPIALHEQDAFKFLNVKKGSLPESEKAATEVVSLPLCPELSDSDQTRVIETISEFYS